MLGDDDIHLRGQRARPRASVDAQHAALQMQHLAPGARRRPAHLHEVVVHVGGKAGRIERAFGLRRRRHEGFGVQRGERQEARARTNAGTDQQAAAREDWKLHPMKSANEYGGCRAHLCGNPAQ